MLRHREELLTPPHSLRRRQHQQSQSSEAGPPGFGLGSGHFLSGSSNQMLDLSICHPARTFSNRFSVLATPPPSTTSFPRDFPAATARRTRNSRGTKEAKKRRDVRRNRRKLAARLLDQQLSQAVDETLTKANYPPPPPPRSRQLPAILGPVPSIPTNGFPLLQSGHFPPTPPELPLPNFSKFDLSAFSHFTISPTASPPLRTPTPFRTLPAWCPRIPSLTLGDVWRDSLPTFHDLSSLPEPVEAPTAPQNMPREPCKDIQVWRPIGSGYGRDQSRFFPPRIPLAAEEKESEPSNRVAVKLPPPVAHRLHRSDGSAGSLLLMSKSSATQAAISDCTIPHDATSRSVSDCARNKFSEFDLPCRDLETNQYTGNPPSDLNICSSDTKVMTAKAQDWRGPTGHFPWYYDARQPLYEIDGREIELPYVHANSLTGYSNDSDVTETLPSYQELPFLVDSGVDLPLVSSSEHQDMVGLNELVVDHDIMAPVHANTAAGVPLPVSLRATPPATPPLHPLGDVATILPMDCITEAEHRDSDAHYYSEQALFDQTSPSLTQSTRTLHEHSTVSSINIADFLKLGHAKQCWCGHCTDERYHPSHGEANGSVSSSITLTGGDYAEHEDGSLVLSLVLDPSESEPDTGSDVPEMLNLDDADLSPTNHGDENLQAVEDGDWLLFSHIMTRPVEERLSTASPLYLPSSPILHRQAEQRAPAPTVIITPSGTSANEVQDDYVAVAAPVTSIGSSTVNNPIGHEISVQRPRSSVETGLTLYGTGGIGCVFAKAVESSWRWGRENEED